MADHLKTAFHTNLTRHGRLEIDEALNLTGKALAASIVTCMGSIATIKFEVTGIPQTLQNITVPIAGSQFIRLPLQAGTPGVVYPADMRLGPVTGLGGTTADLSKPGNLSALMFFPCGNMNFAAPEDPNQLELYGFDAALIKSTVNKEWFAQWTKTGVTISNKAGTASIVWNGEMWVISGPAQFAGAVTMQQTLTVTGALTASGGITSGEGSSDLVTLQHHTHAANGEPPTPGA
jgi:hypothetical protein